jgi:hypothetical protein
MAWSSPFFSRPGTVLMGPDDGGVDHHVFGVGVAGQVIQYTIENAALAPPAEALVRAFPGTKMRRQIAPWNACPIAVEHRVDEEPIVWRRTADMPLSPGKKILNPIPLVIAQSISIHWSAPQKADHL